MSRLVASGLPASLAAKRVSVDTSQEAILPIAENEQAPQSDLKPLLLAIDNFDGEKLSHELRRLALALPTHDFFDRVIVPLMADLNARWANFNPTDHVQEHITTQSIRRLMHELCTMVRPGLARGRVLIVPFQNDVHLLPLDALEFMFTSQGFRTLQLGPMTAPSALASVVERTQPDLIAISMSSRVPAAQAETMLKEYQTAVGEVPWIVGGSAAQGLATELEAAGAVLVSNGQALDRYLRNFML